MNFAFFSRYNRRDFGQIWLLAERNMAIAKPHQESTAHTVPGVMKPLKLVAFADPRLPTVTKVETGAAGPASLAQAKRGPKPGGSFVSEDVLSVSHTVIRRKPRKGNRRLPSSWLRNPVKESDAVNDITSTRQSSSGMASNSVLMVSGQGKLSKSDLCVVSLLTVSS